MFSFILKSSFKFIELTKIVFIKNVFKTEHFIYLVSQSDHYFDQNNTNKN